MQKGGFGQGRGGGGGFGRGQGRGGAGGGFGKGPGGNCICPNCGHKVPHERGVPCRQFSCPKCGSPMVRE